MNYFRLIYEYFIIYKSRLFDAKYYLSMYSDVLESKKDPLLHYLLHGAKEGRNPNESFNTNFYLNRYKDVKDSNFNPFFHYVKFGIKENREQNTQIRNNIKSSYSKHLMLLKQTTFKTNSNKSKNIVIIGEVNIPQCLKYRILQMRKILQDNEFTVEVSGWKDFYRSLHLLQHSSIVIFYRVGLHHNFYEKYFAEAKRLGIKIGYDIDDPIFDIESVVKNSNIDHLDQNIIDNLLNDVSSYLLALHSSDFCIASTSGMKEVIRKSGYKGDIIIRKNGVDKETKNLSATIDSIREDSQVTRLIYATPSKAHQADFLLIEDVLIKILKKYHGRVRLILMGELEFSNKKNSEEVEKYIDRESVGSYKEFLNVLSTVDINLVPLVNSKFNSTKSNIKFLDATSVNVVSICSNIGDYKSLNDGYNCYLADGVDEWFDKLCSLIDNKQRRYDMLEKAKYTLEQEYDLKVVGQDLVSYIQKGFENEK